MTAKTKRPPRGGKRTKQPSETPWWSCEPIRYDDVEPGIVRTPEFHALHYMMFSRGLFTEAELAEWCEYRSEVARDFLEGRRPVPARVWQSLLLAAWRMKRTEPDRAASIQKHVADFIADGSGMRLKDPARSGHVEFEVLAPQEIAFGDLESYWSECVHWWDLCGKMRQGRAVRLLVPPDEVAVVKWCALQAAIEREQSNPNYHYDGRYLYIWTCGDPAEALQDAQRRETADRVKSDAERAALIARCPVTISRDQLDRPTAQFDLLTERLKGRKGKGSVTGK